MGIDAAHPKTKEVLGRALPDAAERAGVEREALRGFVRHGRNREALLERVLDSTSEASFDTTAAFGRVEARALERFVEELGPALERAKAALYPPEAQEILRNQDQMGLLLAGQEERGREAGGVAWRVYPKDDPPHGYRYAEVEGQVLKGYDRGSLVLRVTVTNGGPSAVTVVGLDAVVLQHAGVQGRVLMQWKMKGVPELHIPPRREFVLAPLFGPSPILKDEVWEIGPGAQSTLEVVVSEATPPGSYEFVLQARAVEGAGEVQLESEPYCVLIPSEEKRSLRVHVYGKHYDSAAPHLLRLPRPKWRLLRKVATDRDRMLYLGPTPDMVLRGERDEVWRMRAVQLSERRRDQSGGWTAVLGDSSEFILSLDVPVGEPLYNLSDAVRRTFGEGAVGDGWG